MDPCISLAYSLPFSSFEDATESGSGNKSPRVPWNSIRLPTGELTDGEPFPEILGISNTILTFQTEGCFQ